MTKNKLDLIFKSYDIRGIYGDSIDQEIAYKIGKAFAEFVPDDNIIVGLDGRISNIEMLDAFTSGIRSKQEDNPSAWVATNKAELLPFSCFRYCFCLRFS